MVSAGVLSTYYQRKSYILCSDLSLWDQYLKCIKENKLDFGYLKGQTNNYHCSVNNNPVRCAECRINGKSWAYLMKNTNKDFPCARKCSYVKERKRACLKSVTLMTYQCYLYTLMHQEKVDSDNDFIFSPTPREIIFCDECHHLPDVVMTQFSPHISETDLELAEKVYSFIESKNDNINSKESVKFKKELRKIYNDLKNKNLSNDENLNLISEFYFKYQELWDLVKEQEDYYKDNYKQFKLKDQKEVSKIYKLFENVILYGDQFRDLLAYLDSSDFLVKEINGNILNFYNLKQDFLVYKCVLSKAHHRVMLSATVGDEEVFYNNIGINYFENKSYTFKRIPSTFNFEKSPVLIYPDYKLSWKNKETLFPKIKKLVYDICNKFENEKGLIQTTSYADALEIYNTAPDKIKERLLIYNNSSEKGDILKKHIQKENSILLGPTLNEGLDFPDDLCRFVIITKVPYPQLNNEFTKKKMIMFKGWYDSATSLKIIQTIGRGVRHENDYCQTFILDGCFLDLLKRTKKQYSEELQKRFIIETE